MAWTMLTMPHIEYISIYYKPYEQPISDTTFLCILVISFVGNKTAVDRNRIKYIFYVSNDLTVLIVSLTISVDFLLGTTWKL